MSLASPCTNVCRMDAASGLCLGCQRRLEEIAAWGAAPEAERRRILEAVAVRRAALPHHPSPLSAMDDPDNPCIGICTIEDGYCLGCGRSEADIFGEAEPVPAPLPPAAAPAPLPDPVRGEMGGGSD